MFLGMPWFVWPVIAVVYLVAAVWLGRKVGSDLKLEFDSWSFPVISTLKLVVFFLSWPGMMSAWILWALGRIPVIIWRKAKATVAAP